MIVHSNNRQMFIKDKTGITFEAWSTHVENPVGKHLFIITAEPGMKQRLHEACHDIAAMLKNRFDSKGGMTLEYIERYPDGTLHRIDLRQPVTGPGIHGEPEHYKQTTASISVEQILPHLGSATLPVAPVIKLDKPADLTEERLPGISKAEKMQVKSEHRKTNKPKF